MAAFKIIDKATSIVYTYTTHISVYYMNHPTENTNNKVRMTYSIDADIEKRFKAVVPARKRS